MVVLNSHLGSVTMTKRFFTSLIGATVTDCYGVVGMNSGTLWQNAVENLPFLKRGKYPEKGVNVKQIDGKVFIDLHITVSYGINVSSVVKSIQHKVTYVVEEQTGIDVARVNVYVDEIKS